jgi:hypothetical protein
VDRKAPECIVERIADWGSGTPTSSRDEEECYMSQEYCDFFDGHMDRVSHNREKD